MKRNNRNTAICLALAAVLMMPFAADTVTAEDLSAQLYTAEDVQQLRNYLAVRDTDLAASDGYDLNGDGIWNAIDLTLMKRACITTENTGNVITVSDAAELKAALAAVMPGDTILLLPGLYQTDESGKSGSLFYSAVSGTAEQPITIKSADAENPAVLSGTTPNSNMVLYIVGEHWDIENIVCCNAKKGIMLDQASYSVVKGVEVYNIGEEGIHVRDGSSYCQVLDSKVHDTGLLTPQYGEAVYLGSAKSTTAYSYDCNYNLVKGCILGPNVTAEHVDIKEYTTGNIIENCTMYGGGMTDTDSFLDIKGNKTIVRNNICDAQNNTTITDAFQVHCQVDGWGIDNLVYGNQATFAGDTEYVVRIWNGTSCTVYENTRFPENADMMYRAYSGSTLTIQ